MKLTEVEKHHFLKCAEELNELAVEILHAVNKTKKENCESIKNEIKDVECYLEKIKQVCNK